MLKTYLYTCIIQCAFRTLAEDQEVTEAEFSTAWSAVFDGYLTTHSIHCSSSSGGDDDDRK